MQTHTFDPNAPCSPVRRIRPWARWLGLAFALLVADTGTAAAAECESPQFNNRSVNRLSFRADASGQPVLQILTGLRLGEQRTAGTNASFDLRVFVNGRLAFVLAQDVVLHSAITCAVTCSGECPSIFGDGACTGCGCDYSNWLTAPTGPLEDGDIVEVWIVPARGGQPEVEKRDDRMRIVFDSAKL